MLARFLPIRVREPQIPATTATATPGRYLHFGEFDFDAERQELFRAGERVKLPGKVCEVLQLLIEQRGSIVTRETLRERLWPPDSQINYDANVNTTVNKLRQALGDSTGHPVYVETIPRKGYVFVAPVQPGGRRVAMIAPRKMNENTRTPAGWSAAASFRRLRERLGGVWFTAGVIALLLAGMALGVVMMILRGHS